jgi:hypothetical protein
MAVYVSLLRPCVVYRKHYTDSNFCSNIDYCQNFLKFPPFLQANYDTHTHTPYVPPYYHSSITHAERHWRITQYAQVCAVLHWTVRNFLILLVTSDEGLPTNIGLKPRKGMSTNSGEQGAVIRSVGFEPDGIKYMRLSTAIQWAHYSQELGTSQGTVRNARTYSKTRTAGLFYNTTREIWVINYFFASP